MCTAFSLLEKCQHLAGQVDVPVVIEALRYLSAEHKVLIAFDFIIRNRSDQPAWVLLTHSDDVEGRLATEDWFPRDESDSDDRMRLLRRIYGKHWHINGTTRTLTYTDPIESGLGEPVLERPIDARALSYRPDAASGAAAGWSGQVEQAWIDSASPTYTDTYRLKALPVIDGQPDEHSRPYSSFCLGPIPANTSAFARVTLVIRDAAYTRLVQPYKDAPFEVISGGLIRQQIKANLENEATRLPFRAKYKKFFDENIEKGRLDPTRYQIIIMQPQEGDRDNQLVRFRPASPTISELPIADPRARNRGLWFNAWSQDFRLVLRYEPNRDFAKPDDRRLRFSDRLSADVGT